MVTVGKALKILRMCMMSDVPKTFSGTVEVDETYLGGAWKNKRKSVKKAQSESKRGRGTTNSCALSLKRFLISQERKLAFQAKNQMMFEKLLPYAIAFGVEKIWAERFKDISLKNPDWYEGHGASSFNSMILVNSLSHSYTGIARAATPTSSSSGFSSGFSGGSSGGGGGGGGGGSW